MRIYLKTTPNTEPVPYTYQTALVGALHKWLDKNEQHDQISLYSMSWLDRGKNTKSGLQFPKGSSFFISSYSEEFIERVVRGVLRDPDIRYGLSVTDIGLHKTPAFGEHQKFFLQSPVLIKRWQGDRTRFFFPDDPESDFLLTETLRHKLHKAGYPDIPVQVSFDRNYEKVRYRLINYKGIANKATLCPILIHGDPDAISFAWDVGVGNSTGIGFGAII
jgi:CRISPR-associated endoribonuclease Cas6